jgi:replicative DNA helicase
MEINYTEIEKKVLGMFLFAETVEDQTEILMNIGSKDFEDDLVRQYFEVISDLVMQSREKVDIVTAYQHLKEYKFFDVKYFSKLTEDVLFSMPDVFRYIGAIKFRNERRDVYRFLVSKANQVKTTRTMPDLDELKEEIIVRMRQRTESKDEFTDIKGYIGMLDKHVNKETEVAERKFGLSELDKLTNGIETPRLIVVGGLKKSGKSRFVINTMHNLYKQGLTSVFISLEMPPYEVAKLTLSRFSGVEEPKLRSQSYISNEEKQRYYEARDSMNWEKIKIMHPEGKTDLASILRKIRLAAKLYPGAVIFIDYLQRIDHDRNRQAQSLETISNAIADATREHNVTIVLLSQMQNIAERETPSIGHLKGSGGIAESADIILLLDNVYRRTKDESKKGIIEIIVEQRYGDSGVVKVYSDLSRSIFQDSFGVEISNWELRDGKRYGVLN